ncbi:MAG: phage tail protein [Planctomycetota bacterium]
MTSTSIPLVGICFEVSAAGKSLGVFSECQGLDVQVGAEAYREGGNLGFVWQLPTQVSHSSVVLKRGLSADKELFSWVGSLSDSGKVTPKDVQISLLVKPGGTAAVSWNVTRAYPLKWTGPSLNATQAALAYESLELAHQGLAIKVCG